MYGSFPKFGYIPQYRPQYIIVLIIVTRTPFFWEIPISILSIAVAKGEGSKWWTGFLKTPLMSCVCIACTDVAAGAAF